MSLDDILLSFHEKKILYIQYETGKIYLHSNEFKLTYDIPTDEFSLVNFLGKLDFIFCNKQIVICWNIKDFLSFILFKINKVYNIECNIYDLKIMESYLGNSSTSPSSFQEAFNRLKSLKSNEKLLSIYNRIHLPLVREIIPDLENPKLVHKGLKKSVRAYYEIEGQVNGRLKCSKLGKNYFNPHSLGKEEKEQIFSSFYNEEFLYLDFSSLEVYILQWLSKDSNLGQIIKKQEDLYESIWEKITSLPGKGNRNKCKLLFLPVMYGQGYRSIAEKFNVSESTAKRLHDSIYEKFPEAVDWLNDCQNSMRNEDYFGRRREFDQTYKIRNFMVQSPSATICLDKLVKLYYAIKDSARIAYYVHDGYCIVCEKVKSKKVLETAKNILESEDEMYPELKLRVSCL